VISIVIHPSVSPASGPDLEVVVGEGVRGAAAFTSAECLARVWPGELMPRTRSPRRLRDAQAMMIRR
jgi:hypothetical protein